MPDHPTSLAPPTRGLVPRLGAGTFRSLRHRNYRLFFFGQLVSLIGSWMQTPALMWLAYELTHKSRWPAFISAAQLLPTFVFGAWTGSLADRWPKRRLLLCTQSALLFLAVLLMVLVLVHDAEPWELLAVTLAAGVVGAVDLPTRLAFVQDMVGREDVINAVALNSVLFNSARAIGPLIGTALLFWKGPAFCFFANALSYLAVLWALANIKVAPRNGPPKDHEGLAGLFAGFAELGRRPQLLLMVLAAGMTSLCGWPFLSLLPALADHMPEMSFLTAITNHDFDLKKLGYGVMLSGTGFGAMSAALTVARFGSWQRRRGFLAGGVSILSTGLVGLSLMEILPLAFLCCAAAGFGLVLFFSTGQGVIQLSAAEHNRGRMLGIWAMMLGGSAPFGNLLVGAAADQLGVEPVLRVQGLACGGAALMLVLIAQRWQETSSANEGA